MNIHKQRVLNLARALRESPAPKRFTMGCVFSGCGAPACVWGHYISRPDLQSEWTPDTGDSFDGGQVPRYSDCAEKHFGLCFEELYLLFNTNGCGGAGTPAQAIAFIEKFAESKWPECRATIPDSVRDIFMMSDAQLREALNA